MGVAGTYGINAEGPNGDTKSVPYVYLDPTDKSGPPGAIHLRILSSLPEYPAVTATPVELCSSELADKQRAVRCIDNSGLARAVPLGLDELASALGVKRECLQIEDRIGSRNLSVLSTQWQTTLSACKNAATTGKEIPITLEIGRPPSGSGCSVNGIFTCAAVRLSVPAIGLKRDLGNIENYSSCLASHLSEPEGIQLGCSDLSISLAEVYHYGNTVLYRTAVSELANDHKGSSLPMRSFTLPCGVTPSFRIRSFESVEWTTRH